MTDKLIEQIILQAPTVAILLYILFRFEALINHLITVLIQLAQDEDERAANARLDALQRRDR